MNSDRPENKPSLAATASAAPKSASQDAITPPQGCSPIRKSSRPPVPRPRSSRPAPKPAARSQSDLTPAPVVIGVDHFAAPQNGPPREDHSRQLPDVSPPLWLDPDARQTPAEPVASLRVRQSVAAPAPNSPVECGSFALSDSCEEPEDTATDLQPPAQYFPPTRPPESLPGHVATHPKVQVVPDCDAKIRTVKSLRRQSTIPPVSNRYRELTHGWPLYVLVSLGACGLAVALARGLVHSSRRTPSASLAPATSLGVGADRSSAPISAIALQPTVHRAPDAGLPNATDINGKSAASTPTVKPKAASSSSTRASAVSATLQGPPAAAQPAAGASTDSTIF